MCDAGRQLPSAFNFDPCDPFVLLWYSLVNIVVTSVIPVPLAGPLTVAAALLFGLPRGLILNLLTSVMGAFIGLTATRVVCRPCFMRCLGRHHKLWEALDQAILEQGWQIALLIRIAPVSPLVITNILLSLTSVDTGTYLWTCAVGLIPANLPYAYAAVIGLELASEFPPSDPVMLSVTVLGLAASIAIAWKVGLIATRLLRDAGVGAVITDGLPDVPLSMAAGCVWTCQGTGSSHVSKVQEGWQDRGNAASGRSSEDEVGDVEQQNSPRTPTIEAGSRCGSGGSSDGSGRGSSSGGVHASGALKKKGSGALNAFSTPDCVDCDAPCRSACLPGCPPSEGSARPLPRLWSPLSYCNLTASSVQARRQPVTAPRLVAGSTMARLSLQQWSRSRTWCSRRLL